MVALLGLPGAAAEATTIDLSANLSGTLNGAVFAQFDPFNGAGAGSGNIDAFVRYDGPGPPSDIKRGYNVDVASQTDFQYDELWGQFTHSLLLSAVPVVQYEGTAYREFIFDINETGGAGSVLSLDKVEVFLADAGDLVGHGGFAGGTTSLIYNMDAGDPTNFVLLDGDISGSGSGKFDMLLLVPEAFFAGADPSLDYVILYSQVGAEGGLLGNDDGFNEWGVSMNGGVIPEPGTFSLLAIGLVSLAVSRRRAR
ncbi:MAG: PEP-CTERM sorting domain-containing protein [Deltaproteobacteria bacterium]|nr:PEP-CTERM sorting domain-containing protein [Deltaproteobacteria bacterium]